MTPSPNGRPETDRDLLYLVDAYALIYRAYYAMIGNPLTTSTGLNTSAPYGVARFIGELLREHDPAYAGVVFDAGHSFREELYPAYKATREKMPDDLRASLPWCRAIVEGFRVPVIEAEGWEADDVIATLARQAAERGIQTVILSGDKDFYQLIDEDTWLLNPGRSGRPTQWVTPANAGERLGVGPDQVVDYLALVGDSSDNVPGVRGIGKKTAPRLLDAFDDLEAMLDGLDTIESGRARGALERHGEDGLLSKKLVTIRTDAPVGFEVDRLVAEAPDAERLREVFVDLEFYDLADRYAADENGRAARTFDVERRYELVTDPGHVQEVVAEMRAAGRFAVDTETTSTDPMRAELVGISLCAEPGRAYYLPFAHRAPRRPTDAAGNPVLALGLEMDREPDNLPAPTAAAMRPLAALLADPDVAKVGQHIKYDRTVLERAGLALEGVAFDTSLASYCLDPGKRKHSLDALALEHLDTSLTSYEDVCGSGGDAIGFDEVAPEEAAAYAAEDADYTLRLAEVLSADLAIGEMETLFEGLEMPLSRVLARMEQRGVKLDPAVFERLEAEIGGRLAEVEAAIAEAAGYAPGSVNLRSVPQLRELLFGELGLPVIKRTKTGPSTDQSVLDELAGRGHAVPAMILTYRELEKLRSTYVSVLPGLVHPKTGRVHASFHQTVAATGRLSSSDPNLQNIPIRRPLGREIRKGFVAEDGWVLLGADYSQVELRVMAHLSGDEAFVRAFREGRDVHAETAARIFGVEPEDVSAGMRDRAKTINFATLYGQGARSLARDLGISVEEAAAFIEQYFERFDGVARYLERQKALAAERGWVETLTGRRRYLPEITSDNGRLRSFGERAAANTPIQGTAADLIKRAMIRLEDALDADRARMLLQVHDELVFEVREEAVEEVRGVITAVMEGAMALEVPLAVDVGVGRSWYEAKG